MTAQNGMLAEAAMLLERGCAVDLKAVAGHTPLHLAATYGNAEMIELLLQAGHASVDAEDNTGRRYSVYLLD
jgi:ankyrin repeat protein